MMTHSHITPFKELRGWWILTPINTTEHRGAVPPVKLRQRQPELSSASLGTNHPEASESVN